MRNRALVAVAVAVTAFALSGAAHAVTPASDPAEFAALRTKYVDGLLRAKPHLATFMGEHRWDAELPDFSPGALKKREQELTATQKSLDALKPTLRSLDAQVDAEIMADGIALELLYLREIRDWEWDPRLYDSFPYYDPREIVAGRLSDIIHGDFAPEAQRKASVVAQLRALPKLLAQSRHALEHGWRRPSKEYADQAVKGNRGRIEFFETEVKPFANDAKAYDAALAALKEHQAFLEKLAKGPFGDWRLGATLYRKKFPLALQTTLTADDTAKRAEAAFAVARGELIEIAARLHDQLWPKEPKVVGQKLDRATATALVNRVRDEIAKDHARPAELVAAHGRNLDQLRAFIEKHDLLALPPRDTLLVEPMPAFKRGSSAAEYLAPGVLEHRTTWHATYYVDPIDPTWTPDKVESYLRGQNDYEVQLVAAHEAYPGHHTQYSYAKRVASPLRAVMWNAPMVEGWAVYGEGLMVENGWGGGMNDRFRFYDARGRMIVATNAMIDVKLQSGTMTDDEAVRFMADEGFQERAMAEKKLLRAKLDSTQLAQYFLGYDEIRALERDYRGQVGKEFTQRRFNEALIGQGSIAIKFLRRYLLK
jgi:uncharacterized protein (DUF885 family)